MPNYGPCKNPNCNHYGRSHPNCHCYDNIPSTTLAQEGLEKPGTTTKNYAEGGTASNCDGMHGEKCEYHMPSDPSEVFHGALIHHGLSNLIKQTSKTDLDDMDKNPHRAFDNYIGSSRKGTKKYSKTIKSTFDNEKPELQSNPKNLDKQMENFKTNPSTAIDAGAAIGHVSPEHSVDLSATIGNASNYLDSIKPKPTANGPLNEPFPVSHAQEYAYDRQVHLVEQPLTIISRIKSGELLPQDTQTLQTVYPKLYEKLKHSVGEEIINAKTSKKEIPYKTKLSLSLFLGQPMDSTLSQPVMQAAMLVNAPKQPQQNPGNTKKAASKPSVSQQEKVNEMFETNTQSRDSEKA